jgi:hypothetical protein
MKSRLIFVLIFAVVGFFIHSNAQHTNDILPSGIESSKILLEDTDALKGCGILLFILSKESLNEIKTNKLSFFKKSFTSHSKKQYGKWKETPFDEDVTSDNLSFNRFTSGLNYARSEKFHQYLPQIQSKIKINGSYYSEHNRGRLLVIPDYNLVVYSYSD